MAEAVQVSRRLRRLIAACDGTWNSTDRQTHTTNGVRLARSIRSCTSDGISQIVSGQFPRPYPSRPAEDQVHRRLGYGWVTGHSR